MNGSPSIRAVLGGLSHFGLGIMPPAPMQLFGGEGAFSESCQSETIHNRPNPTQSTSDAIFDLFAMNLTSQMNTQVFTGHLAVFMRQSIASLTIRAGQDATERLFVRHEQCRVQVLD